MAWLLCQQFAVHRQRTHGFLVGTIDVSSLQEDFTGLCQDIAVDGQAALLVRDRNRLPGNSVSMNIHIASGTFQYIAASLHIPVQVQRATGIQVYVSAGLQDIRYRQISLVVP